MSKIKLALDVVNDLRSLADSLGAMVQAAERPEEVEEIKAEEVKLTIEDVRSVLVALTRAGKQAEVKALVTKYGASKLSEIPADKYPELLNDAGEIR